MTITIIKSSAGVKHETKHPRGARRFEGVADKTNETKKKKKKKKKKGNTRVFESSRNICHARGNWETICEHWEIIIAKETIIFAGIAFQNSHFNYENYVTHKWKSKCSVAGQTRRETLVENYIYTYTYLRLFILRSFI